MPDYKDSKIYKITCNITGLTYYGSTTQRISKRMGEHRCNFKKNRGGCKSKLVLASGDYDYCLVEKVECSDKSELHRRERFYIESFECVNLFVPCRTKKEYYDDNKEKAAEYYSDNKERLSKVRKEYRSANRDIISARKKLKITCDCGCTLRKNDMARHRKSQKHINLMSQIEQSV